MIKKILNKNNVARVLIVLFFMAVAGVGCSAHKKGALLPPAAPPPHVVKEVVKTPVGAEKATAQDAAREHFLEGLKKMEKEPEEAIKSFNLALLYRPNIAEAHYNLGLIFYRLGDKKNSKEEMLRALRVNPRYEKAYVALAMFYVREGKTEDAKNSLLYAASFTGSPEPLINLGNLYQAEGKYDISLEYYRRAEKEDPGNPYLNFNMGMLFLKKGDLKEARAKMEKSGMLTGGKRPDALLNYANALAKTGEIEAALKIYEDIVKINPTLPAPHKNMGIIYEIYMNDFRKALEHYRTYLSLEGEKSPEVSEWANIVEEKLKKEEKGKTE